MSGNPYQFVLKQILPIGTYIHVNGPHDKFGQVYAHGDTVSKNATIHFIRGIGNELPRGKYAWALEEANETGGKGPTT